MPAYGSGTFNAVDSKRNPYPAQDPIGATVDPTDDVVTLANGTIGGGFSHADDVAQFALGTPGRTDAEDGAIYVQTDVDIVADSTALLVVGTSVTAATGGTYTSPVDALAGQYLWVFVT